MGEHGGLQGAAGGCRGLQETAGVCMGLRESVGDHGGYRRLWAVSGGLRGHQGTSSRKGCRGSQGATGPLIFMELVTFWHQNPCSHHLAILPSCLTGPWDYKLNDLYFTLPALSTTA
jgi:hypothetical protein